MKSKKVLHISQFPSRLPVTFTISVYLLLDKFQSPGWVWGVNVTLMAILWISAIHGIHTETDVKIKELE